MSGLPRVVRFAAWGFGALLGLALAAVLAIIAWAEWRAAITAPGAVPASFPVEGPRVGTTVRADQAGALVLLVGDSLGGYSAMAAAEALPREQLRGLVLAGCTSPRETSRLFAYLKNIVMVTTMRLVVDEPRFVGRALASLGVAEGDARGIVAGGVSLQAVPFAERALLFTDFQASLARVAATVLIVNGDLDARAIAGEAGFAAAAASASVHHFQNTPHGVSMRRSAEFASLVNRFAAQVLGAAPPR